MYTEVEWLIILLCALLGIGIIGGTYFRSMPGERDMIGRYGCLGPAVGLGGLGVVGVVGGMLLLDPGMDIGGALLYGAPPVIVGLGAGYAFYRNDFGLGKNGGYALGAGSLLLSGGLAFGLAGPSVAPGPQPTATPTATAGAPATTTPSLAPTPSLTATPTASAPPTSTATATAVAPTAPTTPPISQRTDFFDALIELGALEQGRVDDYMEDYQTDPEGDHSHATGQAPGFTPPFVDIRGHVGFSWMIDDETAAALNGAFPCTTPQGVAYRIQCLGPNDITAGNWVFVNVMAHGMLPDSFSGSALANLAVVFDDDGDPLTGYRPDPAFPGDSFQGSTRWFEQFWFGTTSQCFATDATDLNDDGVPVRNNTTSMGRFITWHQNSMGVAEYTLMLPASEVGLYYRAVIVGTQDGTTYAPQVTSHDYTEADGAWSFQMLETY